MVKIRRSVKSAMRVCLHLATASDRSVLLAFPARNMNDADILSKASIRSVLGGICCINNRALVDAVKPSCNVLRPSPVHCPSVHGMTARVTSCGLAGSKIASAPAARSFPDASQHSHRTGRSCMPGVVCMGTNGCPFAACRPAISCFQSRCVGVSKKATLKDGEGRCLFCLVVRYCRSSSGNNAFPKLNVRTGRFNVARKCCSVLMA
jgi:hypothetical protein